MIYSINREIRGKGIAMTGGRTEGGCMKKFEQQSRSRQRRTDDDRSRDFYLLHPSKQPVASNERRRYPRRQLGE